MLKETLMELSREKGGPCLTISLNTHRTRPDFEMDRIALKNLCSEAQSKLLEEYGQRDVPNMLKQLAELPEEVDHSVNLDSMHVFLSENSTEVVRVPWHSEQEGVILSDSFSIRPLMKNLSQRSEYLILTISQKRASLYAAVDDKMADEIVGHGFPFSDIDDYIDDPKDRSDAKQYDNKLREYLNTLDKGVTEVCNATGLGCVVVTVEDNYNKLMEVADKPSQYIAHVSKNFTQSKHTDILSAAWDEVKKIDQHKTQEALDEIHQGVTQGLVITDLQEVFMAAKEGRGDLLVIHQEFHQPVVIHDDGSLKVADSSTNGPGAVEDVTSALAWEVLSKKGRVFFTDDESFKELGEVALKLRY